MTQRSLAFLGAALFLGMIQPGLSWAQSGDFVAGSRDLFVLDLASTPTGELPQVCGPKKPPPCLEMLRGNVTTVDKDGQRMLRAADPAQLWLRLPQVMPNDFTIEIDLIPKSLGLAPSDFAFEGAREQNRGVASMMVEWSTQHLAAVGGATENGSATMFQRDQPEDLMLATSAQLTELRTSFDNGTFKLYVNGQRLVNLPGRTFARGRGIRLELGGQDDDKAAVYVAKLRIATNSPKPQ